MATQCFANSTMVASEQKPTTRIPVKGVHTHQRVPRNCGCRNPRRVEENRSSMALSISAP